MKEIIKSLGESRIYSNKITRDLLKPKKRRDVSSDLIDIGYDKFYYKAVRLITKLSKYAINNVANKPRRSFLGFLTFERLEYDSYSGSEKLYSQLKLVPTYYEIIEATLKRIEELEIELSERVKNRSINNASDATLVLAQIEGLNLIKQSYLTLASCYQTVMNSPELQEFRWEMFTAEMDLIYFGGCDIR